MKFRATVRFQRFQPVIIGNAGLHALVRVLVGSADDVALGADEIRGFPNGQPLVRAGLMEAALDVEPRHIHLAGRLPGDED